ARIFGRGGFRSGAAAAPQPNTSAATSATPALGLRTSLRACAVPFELRQRPLRPDDRRASVLETVQERQVGEEVLSGVDSPLDRLQLGETFLGEPLSLEHLVGERIEVGMTAEEELQQQAVAGHARDRVTRVEPGPEGILAVRRDPVDLLVGAPFLDDGRDDGEPALDKPGEDRVDLALCGPPEIADAPLRELVELVT